MYKERGDITLSHSASTPLPAEGVNYDEIDAKDPETLTEVEKIALLGRPRLGDVTKVQIRVKESKEFKVGDFIAILL